MGMLVKSRLIISCRGSSVSDATSENTQATPRPSRQEVTDVIQQLRAEVNEAISGRMMNSISAALQKVSAKPQESKPYRISDLIPRNWHGINQRESSEASCRTCTCESKRGQIKENRCLPGRERRQI